MYPFCGPLIPLFWTSVEVFPGFQSQSGFLAYRLYYLHTIPRFTSCVIPIDLLMASMVNNLEHNDYAGK